MAAPSHNTGAQVRTQTTTHAATIAASLMVAVSSTALLFTWGMLSVGLSDTLSTARRVTPTDIIQDSLGTIVEFNFESDFTDWQKFEKQKKWNGLPPVDAKIKYDQARDKKRKELNQIKGRIVAAAAKQLGKSDHKKVAQDIEGYEVTELSYSKIYHIPFDQAGFIKDIPGVKNIYPEIHFRPHLQQADIVIHADQVWGQDRFGADCSSDPTNCLNGRGVSIAILDTGVDYRHESFGSCTLVKLLQKTCAKIPDSYDFYRDDADPMDEGGHGTHSAGVSAGDSIVQGIAPKASILAYKVGAANTIGGGAMVAAINRALDPNRDGDFSDRADIINMSFGGFGDPDDFWSLEADRAVDAGMVVVASAGNSGPDGDEDCRHHPNSVNAQGGNGSSNSVCSPAAARKAIAVAATFDHNEGEDHYVDENHVIDQVTLYSSRGPMIWLDDRGQRQQLAKPDIAAPGSYLCSARWPSDNNCCQCQLIEANTKYRDFSGTSAAAPVISGVAALLLQKNPDLTPLEIKDILMRTAVDITNSFVAPGTVQNQNLRGAGRVDALAAIQSIVIDVNPPAAPNGLEAIDVSSNQVALRWTDNAFNEISVMVERKAIGQTSFEIIRVLPANSVSYTDSTVQPLTEYSYRIRMDNQNGISGPSNVVIVTTPDFAEFRRGDVTRDGQMNITDPINLLGFLFLGNPARLDCADAADMDDSGNINITDAIFGLNFLFTGETREIPMPGPVTPGPDPTGDALGCATY